MRKESREMNEAFALEVFDKAPYITVSMTRPDSTAYGLPLSLARTDEKTFYFHGALEGDKIDAIKAHPEVCLSAVTRCHPVVGPKDGSFTLEFKSAVAFGIAEIVNDRDEQIRGLKAVCERFLPEHMDAFEASVMRSLPRTTIVRITLTSPATGKRKEYDNHGEEMKWGRKPLNKELQSYVEKEILPRYANFDAAHRLDHAEYVIGQSMKLAAIISNSPNYKNEDGSKIVIDTDMAYAIAAYHDTGLVEGRETHHIASAAIIRTDKNLLRWFTPEQIEIMADAAEDHRASAKSAPRTIYGRLVAEADRAINPISIIKRTMQYGMSHYPELDKEGHWRRTIAHMHEKYAEGGYLQLWIPESPNGERLAELRSIIKDEPRLREIFDSLWEEVAL